ncbi:UNKNOWN [Stylonychia lemnae]|uniref:Uncharacterized protein n=1 Tax=Stylonychia lemnae TaxID=5949 RepID=A0A077ZU75_STYLE|nr:UNKNOWN [Stylonychia lemnae]|eukprot:CDW73427.1 UNKNOWN [Stylonychia lemnae]
MDPESSVQTLLYHISLKLKLMNYYDYGLYYIDPESINNIRSSGISIDVIQIKMIQPTNENAYEEQLQLIQDIKNTKIGDFLGGGPNQTQMIDYNEENIAIRQAAILECIRLIEQQNVRDVHSAQLDIREINTIFPQQLISYFNKKSIYKKVQASKQYLQYNIKVQELEKLYLKLSFQQQPQIGAQYFPIQVVNLTSGNLSKQLKKIPKNQLLLVVTPFCIGFAEDNSKNLSGNKLHKKIKIQLNYELIEDIEISKPQELQINLMNKDFKMKQKVASMSINAFKISYVAENEGEQQILLKTDQSGINGNTLIQEEIVSLINDYLNYKYREKAPKKTEFKNFRDRITPIDIEEIQLKFRYMEFQQINSTVYNDLREYIQENEFTLKDAFDQLFDGKVYLAQLIFQNVDEEEKYLFLKLQKWIRHLLRVVLQEVDLQKLMCIYINTIMPDKFKKCLEAIQLGKD